MSAFKWRQFTGEVILWAVRWCRYGISYRELAEMLAERGVEVDHTTLYRWTQRYAPGLEQRTAWYHVLPASGSRERGRNLAWSCADPGVAEEHGPAHRRARRWPPQAASTCRRHSRELKKRHDPPWFDHRRRGGDLASRDDCCTLGFLRPQYAGAK